MILQRNYKIKSHTQLTFPTNTENLTTSQMTTSETISSKGYVIPYSINIDNNTLSILGIVKYKEVFLQYLSSSCDTSIGIGITKLFCTQQTDMSLTAGAVKRVKNLQFYHVL